jgi:hypothetical protein
MLPNGPRVDAFATLLPQSSNFVTISTSYHRNGINALLAEVTLR